MRAHVLVGMLLGLSSCGGGDAPGLNIGDSTSVFDDDDNDAAPSSDDDEPECYTFRDCPDGYACNDGECQPSKPDVVPNDDDDDENDDTDGEDDDDDTAFVEPLVVTSVFRSCSIARNGRLICWGGDLGSSVHTLPPESYNWTTRRVGFADGFACAILKDSRAKCWGEVGERESPTSLVPDEQWDQLSFDVRVGCGIRIDGGAVCWGKDIPAKYPPAGSYKEIVVGQTNWACAITTDGAGVCWGQGVGEGEIEAPPTSDAVDVVDGGFAPIWLMKDGSLKADPVARERFPPSLTPGVENRYKQISCEDGWCCGVLLTGEIACRDPALAFPPGKYRYVSTSSGAACAIGEDYSLLCVGEGDGVKPPITSLKD